MPVTNLRKRECSDSFVVGNAIFGPLRVPDVTSFDCVYVPELASTASFHQASRKKNVF